MWKKFWAWFFDSKYNSLLSENEKFTKYVLFAILTVLFAIFLYYLITEGMDDYNTLVFAAGCIYLLYLDGLIQSRSLKRRLKELDKEIKKD